jgi:hypothetical protein
VRNATSYFVQPSRSSPELNDALKSLGLFCFGELLPRVRSREQDCSVSQFCESPRSFEQAIVCHYPVGVILSIDLEKVRQIVPTQIATPADDYAGDDVRAAYEHMIFEISIEIIGIIFYPAAPIANLTHRMRELSRRVARPRE